MIVPLPLRAQGEVASNDIDEFLPGIQAEFAHRYMKLQATPFSVRIHGTANPQA